MWIHWNYPQMIDKKSERPICLWAQKISSRKIKLCMFVSLYVNVFEIVGKIYFYSGHRLVLEQLTLIWNTD